MNKKRILQTIGIFFILITTSVFSRESASGQSKNNSTTIDNLKSVKIFARGTKYLNDDAESAAGKTASLIPISTVKKLGLQCIAVDPSIIPYGSFIIGKDKYGNDLFGAAVDTGGAVKSCKAAKQYALRKGFGKKSPEYNALVLDLHSSKIITREWDHFTVVIYDGPSFKFKMSQSQRIEHLKMMKKVYMKFQPQLAAR